jgi:AcrR family transcriptional regulator
MPKIVNHDGCRQKLLGQAFTLFAERGYAAVTMRDIAKELKVSTGTLYHYFPTKEALFRGLISSFSERDGLQMAGQNPKASLEQRLMNLVKFMEDQEDYFRQQIMLLVSVHQAMKDTPQTQTHEAAQRYRQTVTDLTGLNEAEVTLVLSQLLGLVLLRLFEGSSEPFSRQAKPLVKLIVNGKKVKG